MVLGCFSFVKAQEIQSKKGENYLPETGDWAIGFGVNDVFRYLGNTFNGNLNNNAPNLNYVDDVSFVGKKFITDKRAIRVSANLKYSTVNEEIFQLNDVDVLEKFTIKENTLSVKLGVGKEWRKGKTRLQGFYGSDVFIKLNYEKTFIKKEGLGEGNIKKSGGGFGINGFIGAEYFIFPKIAIGAQYSYGAEAIYENEKLNDGVNEIGKGNSKRIGIGGVGISTINLTLHF